jgi:hypothetical protein
MANKILTGEGWQGRIRNLLGVDSAFIPDSDIEQPDIVDIAEANIIELVPGYATLTGDKKIYLESATACECAVLACDSMPTRLPTKESGPHATYELSIDWDQKKAELQDKRDVYLSKLIKMPKMKYFTTSG